MTTLPFEPPSDQSIQNFMRILEENRIPVTIRKRKGAEIDAACGQLRLQAEQKQVT